MSPIAIKTYNAVIFVSAIPNGGTPYMTPSHNQAKPTENAIKFMFLLFFLSLLCSMLFVRFMCILSVKIFFDEATLKTSFRANSYVDFCFILCEMFKWQAFRGNWASFSVISIKIVLGSSVDCPRAHYVG